MPKNGLWAAMLAVSLIVFAPLGQAQEKSAVREGFSAGNLSGQKILLFRPSVWVGEQSTGGMAEPNADWTAQAREFLARNWRGARANSATSW